MTSAATSLRVVIAALLALVCPIAPAVAVDPSEQLEDPALEERARDISAGLRCLVCQNQSIDDSDAELAKDLRVLVRERLKAGDSDDQVLSFVVERYGEFVLLRPPFDMRTLLLWFAPALLLLAAIAYVVARVRAGPTEATAAASAPAPLTAEEQARLDNLIRARGDHDRARGDHDDPRSGGST